jgi:hypothetical protein
MTVCAPPLIKPCMRFSCTRISGSHSVVWPLALWRLPRSRGRHPPESVGFMQPLIRVVTVQDASAGVFAPHPSARTASGLGSGRFWFTGFLRLFWAASVHIGLAVGRIANRRENEAMPLGQTEAGLPGGIRRMDRCRALAALHLRRHARRQKAR